MLLVQRAVTETLISTLGFTVKFQQAKFLKCCVRPFLPNYPGTESSTFFVFFEFIVLTILTKDTKSIPEGEINSLDPEQYLVVSME